VELSAVAAAADSRQIAFRWLQLDNGRPVKRLTVQALAPGLAWAGSRQWSGWHRPRTLRRLTSKLSGGWSLNV